MPAFHRSFRRFRDNKGNVQNFARFCRRDHRFCALWGARRGRHRFVRLGGRRAYTVGGTSALGADYVGRT